MAFFGVEFVVAEAEFFVGVLGDYVAGEDFEGDFAGADVAGDVFDFGHDFLAEALAFIVGVDGHVVDVDEGGAFEGGEAFEAIGEARGFVVNIGDDAESGGAGFEVFYEVRADMVADWRAAAHGVSGVAVEEGEDVLRVVGVGVVRADDVGCH